MGSSNPDDSTLPEGPSERELRRERWLRNATVLLVVSFVLLGSLSILGVRTSTVTAEGNGYRMQITYAAVTRGGLATPFAIEVGTEDGSALPDVVTIRVSAEFLALFDDNGMEPIPASSFNTPDFTSWDFEVPPGAPALEVALDARMEPAVQWGEAAVTELWIGGEPTLVAEFRSWVMP